MYIMSCKYFDKISLYKCSFLSVYLTMKLFNNCSSVEKLFNILVEHFLIILMLRKLMERESKVRKSKEDNTVIPYYTDNKEDNL